MGLAQAAVLLRHGKADDTHLTRLLEEAVRQAVVLLEPVHVGGQLSAGKFLYNGQNVLLILMEGKIHV